MVLSQALNKGGNVQLNGNLEAVEGGTHVSALSRVGTHTTRIMAIWLSGFSTIMACVVCVGLTGESDLLCLSVMIVAFALFVIVRVWRFILEARSYVETLPHAILGVT